MSILFNGSTSYVDCGNVLDSTADMTMSCWLKLGSTGVFMDIASKEDTSVAQGWEFFVLYSGEPGFGVFNTTYAFVSALSTLTPGTVYHICGIRDSAASVLRIYINGSLSNSAGSGGPGSTSTANMNIGRSTHNSVYLDGVVGDFRVYNRVLSPDEINALYVARGRDRIFNGLIGHWLFNEQPPGTAGTGGTTYTYDRSTTSAVGSLYGSATFTEGIY